MIFGRELQELADDDEDEDEEDAVLSLEVLEEPTMWMPCWGLRPMMTGSLGR